MATSTQAVTALKTIESQLLALLAQDLGMLEIAGVHALNGLMGKLIAKVGPNPAAPDPGTNITGA